MRVTFLPIPGTTEISIQNGYLYTNSFMDLVSVNLQDIVDATYTSDSFSRNQDRFERPRIYEFVTDQYRFTNDYLIPDNEENDIVIGYVSSGGEQVIYGDSHE
jgi:FMN phosphatase YigB (HAD superfamily)